MRAGYTERHTEGMLKGHIRASKTPRGTLRGTLRRYVRAMEILRGQRRVTLRGHVRARYSEGQSKGAAKGT